MDPENAVMKMYEAQADLILVKEQLQKVTRERDELQRMLLLKNRDSSNTSTSGSGAILELEIKVQEMQTALTELSMKFGTATENNMKSFEEIKKKIDSSSRQAKSDKQSPKNSNSKKGDVNKECNKKENWNSEKSLQSLYADMILVFGNYNYYNVSYGGVYQPQTPLYMFDYKNNLWHTLRFPEQYIKNCIAAVHLNGEIYFFSETVSETSSSYNPYSSLHSTNYNNLHDRMRRNSRWIHSKNIVSCHHSFLKLTVDFTWKKLSAAEHNRINISRSTVAYNNCIWVIGGKKLPGEVTNLVEKYDPIEDCWTEMPSLNSPRECASAIVIGEKIYVCGGKNTDKQVECFDPSLNQWTIICTLPSPRHDLAIVPVGKNFMLLGGATADPSVWKIMLDNSPVECTGMTPLPQGRSSFSAFAFGNTIVVIGGYVDQKATKSGHTGPSVIVCNGKHWKEGPALPSPTGSYISVIVSQELGNKLLHKFV